MAPLVDNVRAVLQGRFFAWIGASIYETTPDTMPALTVNIGEIIPSSTWRYVGLTSPAGGVANFGRTTGTVMTAQYRHSVLNPTNSYEHSANLTFLQVTLDNVRDALGYGTLTNVAPGASTRGSQTLKMTDDQERYVALLFCGVAPPNDGGLPRWIYFPAMQATSTVAITQTIGDTGANAGVAASFMRVGGTESQPSMMDVLKQTGP
jgi:hypothetical protein